MTLVYDSRIKPDWARVKVTYQIALHNHILFIELLNSSGKSLKNLALYVSNAFKLRNETLNDIVI